MILFPVYSLSRTKGRFRYIENEIFFDFFCKWLMFGRLQHICKQHSRFTAVGLKLRRGDTHAVQLTPHKRSAVWWKHKPTGAMWCWRCARTVGTSERCDRQRRMQSSWTVAYLRYAGPVASVCHHTTRYRAGVVLIAPVGASHASGMFPDLIFFPVCWTLPIRLYGEDSEELSA
jgi:hypothetical protein